MPVFKTGAINHSATSPAITILLQSLILRQETRMPPAPGKGVTGRYFVPLGYIRILLASPVFRRAMASEKSFSAIRSVITG